MPGAGGAHAPRVSARAATRRRIQSDGLLLQTISRELETTPVSTPLRREFAEGKRSAAASATKSRSASSDMLVNGRPSGGSKGQTVPASAQRGSKVANEAPAAADSAPASTEQQRQPATAPEPMQDEHVDGDNDAVPHEQEAGAEQGDHDDDTHGDGDGDGDDMAEFDDDSQMADEPADQPAEEESEML